jgi:hypothetical protein
LLLSAPAGGSLEGLAVAFAVEGVFDFFAGQGLAGGDSTGSGVEGFYVVLGWHQRIISICIPLGYVAVNIASLNS